MKLARKVHDCLAVMQFSRAICRLARGSYHATKWQQRSLTPPGLASATLACLMCRRLVGTNFATLRRGHSPQFPQRAKPPSLSLANLKAPWNTGNDSILARISRRLSAQEAAANWLLCAPLLAWNGSNESPEGRKVSVMSILSATAPRCGAVDRWRIATPELRHLGGDRHKLVTKLRRTRRFCAPALLSIESVPDRDLYDMILTSRRAIDSLSGSVLPPGPQSDRPNPRTGAKHGHKAQPELAICRTPLCSHASWRLYVRLHRKREGGLRARTLRRNSRTNPRARSICWRAGMPL